MHSGLLALWHHGSAHWLVTLSSGPRLGASRATARQLSGHGGRPCISGGQAHCMWAWQAACAPRCATWRHQAMQAAGQHSSSRRTRQLSGVHPRRQQRQRSAQHIRRIRYMHHRRQVGCWQHQVTDRHAGVAAGRLRSGMHAAHLVSRQHRWTVRRIQQASACVRREGRSCAWKTFSARACQWGGGLAELCGQLCNCCGHQVASLMQFPAPFCALGLGCGAWTCGSGLGGTGPCELVGPASRAFQGELAALAGQFEALAH